MPHSLFSTKGLKHPLALAVSSCLLVACSTAPKVQPPPATPTTRAPVVFGTSPLHTPTQTPTQVAPTPAVTQPNTGQYVTQGILDSETLAILENLLEARDMSMVEGDAWSVQRYGNLWDRIKAGYRIAQPAHNQRIDAQKRWFSNNQNYLNRLTARASRYLHYTITEAERRGIPTELALLPIIESSYDPAATSNAQAAGLWQFIPSTGRVYGLEQTSSFDGRRDVIESTRAAYDFLTSLYNQFGSWELALAAYNAGPGRIQGAIDANIRAGLPTDYWSLRLPTETMNYVPRFMAVAQIVNSPESNGVYLPKIANHVHFRAVFVNQGVTLSEVAAVTGIGIDELQLLNPALLNGRVEPVAPKRVIIPNSLPAEVDSRLSALRGDGSVSVATMPSSSYVAPNTYAAPIINSGNTLAQTNTLPTTGVSLTPQSTVSVEPPLSPEELRHIAEEVRQQNLGVSLIASDGNINLQALQTGQSLLENSGKTKSLKYNTSKPQQRPSTPPAPKRTTQAPPQSHTIKAGETLIGVARAYGLTTGQLAEYNNLATNAQLLRGQKLWLIPNKAPKTTAKPNTKTTTYKVQSGDTLIGLAGRLGVTASDIAALNAFDANAPLIAGRTITIPATTQPNRSKSQSTPSSYTIKAGDSLTSVAAKHGISVAQLAEANHLATNAGLVRGRTLLIPQAGSSSTPQRASTSAQAPSTEGYKVQAGDTLTALASRFGVSITDLARLNNLSPNAKLTTNQTLKVPKLTTTYTVKSGDTLIGLAKRFGIDTADLAKMNNIKPTDGLRRGQTLTVPNR